MNEPFIIEEDLEARRTDGVVLTGWETVIFELEDEPGYDGACDGAGSARQTAQQPDGFWASATVI